MPRGHVLPDGQTIATLRGEAGLTQDELAARAGYGLRTIGKIESSRPTTSPTLSAVATVLSDTLGRSVELGDLMIRGISGMPMAEPRAPHRDVFIGDHVQWLDLSEYASGETRGAHGPSAVLNETILVRHIPPTLRNLDLSYDARGGVAMGRSLSHADGVVWSSTTDAPWAEMQIPIVNASCVPPWVLQNRVEYFDAANDNVTNDGANYFEAVVANATVRTDTSSISEKQDVEEKFETRVTHPTDCLTLIVSLPFCRGAHALQAFCLGDAEKPTLAPQQPLLLSHGHVIVWRIASPRPRQTYQLRWR
jgi:transcriptional regulator with XRE-family HTH domain